MKIFLIFSAILLIKQSQQSLGGEFENTSESYEITPTGKAFRDVVIAKLVTLSEEPLKSTKKLVEDAYADKSNSVNTTLNLAEFLTELEKTNSEKPSRKIKVFLDIGFLFDTLSGRTILNNYDGRKEEFFALKEALEKHDLKAVANEFQIKFNEFFEWLTQKIDENRGKLTSVEQLRVKSFKDLWQQFKDDTNYETREEYLRAIMRRVHVIDE